MSDNYRLAEELNLSLPQNVQFAPETLNLFDEIDRITFELEKRRPFPKEVDEKISSEFLPDRITATLNIEGISVSRRQTLMMMDAMTLSENSTKAEQEILNALKADEFVFEEAHQESQLSETFIREINKKLQDQMISDAGTYRKKDVEISGAAFQPPSHLSVPYFMAELVQIFNSSRFENPVFQAAWLHATFGHLHPFLDGNGRTGRLLQDWVLLTHGRYPTGIPSQLRDDYYDALEKSDEGDWDPICQMISRLQLSTLTRVQGIVQEREQRKAFIANLAKGARAKKSGTQHKRFLVWKHRMEAFSTELKATASDLNSENSVISVRIDDYPIIEFDKFKVISEEGRAQNTWFMKCDWCVEGAPFYRTIFFFSRHIFRTEDELSKDDLYGTVALFVTGGEPKKGARFDFQSFSDRDIRLREMLFCNDQQYRYYDGAALEAHDSFRSETWQWAQTTNHDVISDLFEDLFRRKLGV